MVYDGISLVTDVISIVPSVVPAATILRWGAKAMASTPPSTYVKVRLAPRFAKSHKRTVLSSLPDASQRPSGEYATQRHGAFVSFEYQHGSLLVRFVILVTRHRMLLAVEVKPLCLPRRAFVIRDRLDVRCLGEVDIEVDGLEGVA